MSRDPTSAGQPRRTAVVDLGSNSFRLVVYTAAERWWRRTDELYEAVRVSAGADERGCLAADRVERALAVCEVFARFCAAAGVAESEVAAVATSAFRDAPNRADFLDRAPLPVRVLTAAEEARYGYLAAANSTTLEDGAVLDVGGGSVQLVAVEGRRARELRSWPLGAVRMTERFLPGDGPASRDDLKALRRHVRHALGEAAWLGDVGPRLVGIGGTLRNLAAAAADRIGQPSLGLQQRTLTRDHVDELVDALAALPVADRAQVSGIKPARADVILAGAVVVQSVLRAGDFPAVDVIEAGLREGVFYERHLAPRDPPLVDEVRSTAVTGLAAAYAMDTPHTAHVTRLAVELFDGLAELGLHDGDIGERELLWAACQLHDIGAAVDYDDHHKHSRYLVLNSGLAGFSPREVVLIGDVVRYHRKGSPSLSAEASAYARKGDEDLLRRCATLLRLAEGLDRGRDGLVRAARPRLDDGVVRIELSAAGDARVSLWAAERETELFERAFGRPLRFRVVEGPDRPGHRLATA